MADDNSDEKVEGLEPTGIGTDVNGIKPELDVKTVKRQTKMEEIRYELSSDEKITKGSELARLYRKIELFEEDKKASAQHYAGLIKAAKVELDAAAESIRSGCEYRSMAVETIHDYKAGTVTRFLKDTGEELDHRKMTNAEARIEIEITQNDEPQQKDEPQHMSDCSVNNGPAMEPGPCDCGATGEAQSPEVETKPKKPRTKKK